MCRSHFDAETPAQFLTCQGACASASDTEWLKNPGKITWLRKAAPGLLLCNPVRMSSSAAGQIGAAKKRPEDDEKSKKPTFPVEWAWLSQRWLTQVGCPKPVLMPEEACEASSNLLKNIAGNQAEQSML
jgi:hypothetical protein